MEAQEHPFANSNLRILLGLSSSLMLVFVAFVFVPGGILRWLLVAFAAVDVVLTPYMLKMVVANLEENEVPQ